MQELCDVSKNYPTAISCGVKLYSGLNWSMYPVWSKNLDHGRNEVGSHLARVGRIKDAGYSIYPFEFEKKLMRTA
jgi:hypothetical protein